MSDIVVGAGDGWVVSVGGGFSLEVPEAVAVSSRGNAGVVAVNGASICCGGGSVACAGLDDDSFGIGVVIASLADMTEEGLSGMEFGAAGATACGLRGAMCSIDEVACRIVCFA